jgi:hypothetical protein
MRRHLHLSPGDEGPYTEDEWRELRRYAHALEERERRRDGALARLVEGLSGGDA